MISASPAVAPAITTTIIILIHTGFRKTNKEQLDTETRNPRRSTMDGK